MIRRPPRSPLFPYTPLSRSSLRTRSAVEAAVAAALTDAGAGRWLEATVTETVEESFRQEKRGRPGADTRFRRTTRTRYTISYQPRDDVIPYDAASDRCFPPATNCTATAASCRPSKPNSAHYSSRSSTCSASRTPPTPRVERATWGAISPLRRAERQIDTS